MTNRPKNKAMHEEVQNLAVFVTESKNSGGHVQRLPEPVPIEEFRAEQAAKSQYKSMPFEFLIERACACGACGNEIFGAYVPASPSGHPSHKGTPQLYAPGHQPSVAKIREGVGRAFMHSVYDATKRGTTAMSQLDDVSKTLEALEDWTWSTDPDSKLYNFVGHTEAKPEDLQMQDQITALINRDTFRGQQIASLQATANEHALRIQRLEREAAQLRAQQGGDYNG